MDNINSTKTVSENRRLIRAGDVIVIIFLLAAAIGICVFRSTASGDPSGTAEITLNGKTIGIVSLAENGEYSYPQLPGMIFTVSDGAICVSESDCKDGICVRSGWISHEGEAAVCAPNRAAVTVKSQERENNDVDAVVR